MTKFNKIRNCVFLLQYHLVLTVKYRKEVFVEEIIISSIKTIFDKIAFDFDIQIIECECGVDHVHILFKSKPTLNIIKFINILKGHSSREVRKKHKDLLKDKLWGDHFWSPSYFLATTGNVTVDVLKDYIESQRKLDK